MVLDHPLTVDEPVIGADSVQTRNSGLRRRVEAAGYYLRVSRIALD
jgi:hypothetical protein